MERYSLRICLALCAVVHMTSAFGSRMDSNILTRLESLEKQVTNQQTQLEVQGKMIADLQNKVNSQETALAEQHETIQKQQTTIDEQQKTITNQQNELSIQQSNQSKHTRRLEQLEELFSRIFGTEKNEPSSNDGKAKESSEGTLHAETASDEASNDGVLLKNRDATQLIQRLNPRLVLASEGPVAFQAVNSHSVINHVGVSQNIVFDKVNLNVGAGYHNQQGVFIAPVDGIYIFSTSILSYITDHSEVQVSMVKNGVALARAYGHGDSGRHDQGSVTVVTQLAANDEVWVNLLTPNDASYWGDAFTSFTGCLLYVM